MSIASDVRAVASLRAQLVLFFGSLLLLTAGALGVAFYGQSRALRLGELTSRGESLARSLAFHSKYGVITRDHVQLLEVSDWAFSQPGVEYVEIRGLGGEILFRRGTTEALTRRDPVGGSLRSFVAPVITLVEPDREDDDDLLALPFDERGDGVGRYAAGTVRGEAEIGLSTATLEAELHRQALRSVLLVAALLIVGAGALFLFLRVVVRPIRVLVEATDDLAAGDLGRRVPVEGRNELARLAVSFNAMSESLLRSRQRIERHEADLEERVRRRTVELERANESLRETQHQLLQAEKLSAIGRLVSGVAHELNNPLAAVLGNAELIERSGQRVPERAAVIRREAERCRRIVGDLLAFARAGGTARGEVDLNRLIAAAIEAQADRLEQYGIEIEGQPCADRPTVAGDGHRLEQLLVNLVSNAADALADRPHPRRIVLGVFADEEGPGLLVRDNGPGIAPEHRGRIFEPFFTTKPVGQGTGLGLSLCYGIVREHGGRIEALDAPGGGACFRVVLRPPEQAVAGRRSGAPAPAERSAVPSRSVLVVDDDVGVAEMVAEALTISGHRVATAANGRLALERLALERFDLILSDLRMPELDGIGLHAEIARRWPEMLDRMVFITGDQAGDATREFLARTGVRCLGKPFSLAELEESLAEAAGASSSSPTP